MQPVRISTSNPPSLFPAQPSPIQPSRERYASFFKDPKNQVEEGGQIRSVGQFYAAMDPKPGELAHTLSRNPYDARRRVLMPVEVTQAKGEIAEWQGRAFDKEVWDQMDVHALVMNDGRQEALVGYYAEPKRGAAPVVDRYGNEQKAQIFAYFPTDTDTMRLQFVAAAA